MKYLLLLAGLALCPALARAQATPVVDVFTDTTTVHGLKISTSNAPGGTDVFELTQHLESYDIKWRSLAIQNQDADDLIVCSPNIRLCTTAGTACYGWEVAYGRPGAVLQVALVPGQRYYCLCTNTSTPCNAALGRGR